MTDFTGRVILTPTDIAWLASRAGVAPTAVSPIREAWALGRDTPPPEGIADRLGSDAWTGAVRTLADPATELVSMIATSMPPLTTLCYGPGTPGPLVACWPEPDEGPGCVGVSMPWTPERLASLAAVSLLASPAPPGDGVELELTPASLLALCCVVDAVRARSLECILRRELDTPLVFEFEALAEQAERAHADDDARWVAPLVATLAPPELPLDPGRIGDGFQRLADAGFVETDGIRWAPGALALRLAADWQHPQPAAAHGSAGFADGELTDATHRITIRGDGPLWTIDIEGMGSDEGLTIRLRNRSPGVYLDELVTLLTPPSTPTTSPQPSAPVRCTACGVDVRTGATFCTACGARA